MRAAAIRVRRRRTKTGATKTERRTKKRAKTKRVTKIKSATKRSARARSASAKPVVVGVTKRHAKPHAKSAKNERN
jgi:hypothetical protein